jgi:hypothetical protein
MCPCHNPPKPWGLLLHFWYHQKALEMVCTFAISQFMDQWSKSYWILNDFHKLYLSLYRLVWILAKLPCICTCNFAQVCLEKCWAQLSLLSPGFLLSAWKFPQVQQTVLYRKRACELALCTLLHWFKLSEPFAHKPWIFQLMTEWLGHW